MLFRTPIVNHVSSCYSIDIKKFLETKHIVLHLILSNSPFTYYMQCLSLEIKKNRNNPSQERSDYGKSKSHIRNHDYYLWFNQISFSVCLKSNRSLYIFNLHLQVD